MTRFTQAIGMSVATGIGILIGFIVGGYLLATVWDRSAGEITLTLTVFALALALYFVFRWTLKVIRSQS